MVIGVGLSIDYIRLIFNLFFLFFKVERQAFGFLQGKSATILRWARRGNQFQRDRRNSQEANKSPG